MYRIYIAPARQVSLQQLGARHGLLPSPSGEGDDGGGGGGDASATALSVEEHAAIAAEVRSRGGRGAKGWTLPQPPTPQVRATIARGGLAAELEGMGLVALALRHFARAAALAAASAPATNATSASASSSASAGPIASFSEAALLLHAAGALPDWCRRRGDARDTPLPSDTTLGPPHSRQPRAPSAALLSSCRVLQLRVPPLGVWRHRGHSESARCAMALLRHQRRR